MVEIRKCIDCGLEQDITLFPVRKGRKPTHSDSYIKRCHSCMNKKQNKNDRARRLRNRTTKECPTCKETKPLKLFKLGASPSNGYSEQCRACIIKQILELCPEGQREKFSPKQKLTYVWTHFGLSGEAYIELIKKSTNCEICNIPLAFSKKCLDHNHETGKLRGVLCPKCNAALGRIYENKDSLLRAIDYLNKLKQDNVLSSNGTTNE